jgi:MYXO-CTERM domain-containing protein
VGEAPGADGLLVAALLSLLLVRRRRHRA